MARFAILEAEQETDTTPRQEADGASLTPQPQHADKSRRSSTPVPLETATASQERQDEVEEVCSDRSYVRDEANMVTTSGESVVSPGTFLLIPAWPWACGGQFNTIYTPHDT